MNRRRTALAGIVGVVSLIAVAALVLGVGSGDDGPPQAGTLDLSGRAILVADGQRETLEAGRHRLSEGDRVQLVEGFGVLALGGGASLELREGRGGTADTEVEVDEPAVLRAGDALLEAPTAARVDLGGTEVGLASGAARLARTTGASVGVYDGLVGLSSGGRDLPGGVPALRQATVATLGAVPSRAAPLDYDPDSPDPWDLRFLGDAIELGAALEARSIGFTRSVDPTADGGFLVEALPALSDQPGFRASMVTGSRTPGELLVGAAVALAGDEGRFSDRWTSVFDFRDEGARWGIVALDQGVVGSSLLALLDGAIADTSLLFDPDALAVALADVAEAGGDGLQPPVDDAMSPPPPGSSDPPPPPGPPPPAGPSTPPALDPVVEPLEPVTDPLEPVTDPLAPVLEPLEPVLEPLEPVTDPLAPVLEPIGPVLEPVGELFGGLLGDDDASAEEPTTDGTGPLLG